MRSPINPARLEPPDGIVPSAPDGITPETWELALALAAVALGYRRLRNDDRVSR